MAGNGKGRGHWNRRKWVKVGSNSGECQNWGGNWGGLGLGFQQGPAQSLLRVRPTTPGAGGWGSEFWIDGCPATSSPECCRKCIVRRVGASYKASGPDASGAYDASYSVVQGVVQHQHRTTQYDIVRPPSPSRRVNDGSGPSWGKGAFGPLPKYWHFASTTCRQCLQLAGRVYLWCTVSTDPRPPSPCAECCLIEGGGQSVA